jgi:hypothetical protein
MLLFTEFQRARTFVPNAPITVIAQIEISPATMAYSNTSPPDSSLINRFAHPKIRDI